MNLENIEKVDPQVAEQIKEELKRQQETIELIASEKLHIFCCYGSLWKRINKQIRRRKTS